MAVCQAMGHEMAVCQAKGREMAVCQAMGHEMAVCLAAGRGPSPDGQVLPKDLAIGGWAAAVLVICDTLYM